MNNNSLPVKSGFVAVIGRPNVGKSSLINQFLGQKIAAVSPRPQTTRKRQMGILTIENESQPAQVVFVDTPGIHQPRHKLGEKMNQEALQTLTESDIILFIVDISQPPAAEDELIIQTLRDLEQKKPLILALNKIDLVTTETLQIHRQRFQEMLPHAIPIEICATRGENIDLLIQSILKELPEGLPFFPTDQLTDLYERELAADLIREAALNILRDEIPHGIAVRIDQFQERQDTGAYIEATLLVEREAHKPIVIGKGGTMMKRIGTAARQEIEAMSGRKVFLMLKVKVRKNWRDDEQVLRQFGY